LPYSRAERLGNFASETPPPQTEVAAQENGIAWTEEQLWKSPFFEKTVETRNNSLPVQKIRRV
jgi:hypothetical protein